MSQMKDALRREADQAGRISDADFQTLTALILDETGIRLPESHHRSVRRFVAGRLATLGMGPDRYLERLRAHSDEYDRFVAAVTIGETYFFREEKHFAVLESHLLPALFEAGRPCLWSAACATGEEAISLAAMAMAQGRGGAPFSVMASDINAESLARFSRGRFSENAFRRDGERFRHLLGPHIRREGGEYHLSRDLLSRIDIRRINLFKDNLDALADAFDVIFLRNVMIYMPMEARRDILTRVIPALKPGGALFLGAAEVPLVANPNLKLMEHEGVYFFRRKSIAEKIRGAGFDARLLDQLQRRREVEAAVRRFMPGGRREPHPVDTRRIMSYASQKLQNPLFRVEDDIDFSVAVQFLQIVCLINADQIAEARDLLELVDSVLPENEISLFLSGYLEMAANRADRARHRYARAIHMAHDFWPARFYLAMLTQDISPRQAYQEYHRCERDIMAYIARNAYHFHFLLEGFNARYFLSMCGKWIERLDRAGEGEAGP